MVANFEKYDMYNNHAELVNKFDSAEFVRIHNAKEAQDFVLDLYRHYYDDEISFTGIPLDWDGESIYRVHHHYGQCYFEAVSEERMKACWADSERHSAKVRFLQECAKKWDEEHTD